MKPPLKIDVRAGFRRRRLSRAKFALGLATLRAAAGIAVRPANLAAVEIGRGCLPPGDRD